MVDVAKDFEELNEAAPSAPGLFLAYQASWAGDPASVKLEEKSRRIGLSWAEAGDSTLYASQAGTPEKRDVWYTGYNKDMAQEFIGDCGKWGRAYNAAASEMEEYEETDTVTAPTGEVIDEKKILAFRIVFNSGWKISALSSRPSNVRGKQGRFIFDEAAFHENLPGILKAALAALIWGGQVHIISTHFGEANPFNGLVQDIRAGRKKYSLHRTTFDDALADGLYKRICEVLGRTWSADAEIEWRAEIIADYGDDADEELFCIPSQGTGIWLSRIQVESCMSADIPVIRYEQPRSFAELPDHIRNAEVADWCAEKLLPLLIKLDPARQSFFGEDFGRYIDLTAITPLQETQGATFRAPFVCELRDIPFQQQEQILKYIVDRLPRFRFGALDANGNGSYLAERMMQRYGASRIAQVMPSLEWYRENMPRYKAAFEDRSILLPKDADIMEDHRAVKVIKGVAQLPNVRIQDAAKKKRHGDTAISGAMAWFATRKEHKGMGLHDYMRELHAAQQSEEAA